MLFLTLLGIFLNTINLEKHKKISMVLYLFMGWMIIFTIKDVITNLGFMGTLYLLIGGILYTVGAIIYKLGKKIKYMHSLWHLFVLGASVFQFFSIFLYVIR